VSHDERGTDLGQQQEPGCTQEPEIRGRTIPKNPFRFPLNIVNGDYAAQIIPDDEFEATGEPHLRAFKESLFADTSTHTRYGVGGSRETIGVGEMPGKLHIGLVCCAEWQKLQLKNADSRSTLQMEKGNRTCSRHLTIAQSGTRAPPEPHLQAACLQKSQGLAIHGSCT
jgi:hypothetical protein